MNTKLFKVGDIVKFVPDLYIPQPWNKLSPDWALENLVPGDLYEIETILKGGNIVVQGCGYILNYTQFELVNE